MNAHTPPNTTTMYTTQPPSGSSREYELTGYTGITPFSQSQQKMSIDPLRRERMRDNAREVVDEYISEEGLAPGALAADLQQAIADLQAYHLQQLERARNVANALANTFKNPEATS